MQFIAIIVILFFVIKFFTEASSGTLIFIAIGIAMTSVALIAFPIRRSHKEREKREKQVEYIREKAIEYKSALAKKRAQLIVTDDYGDIDESKWNAEIVLFFNKKIGSIPEGLALSTPEQVISGDEIAQIIDSVARDGQKGHDEAYSYSEEMNGIDYEHFCADLLRKNGWNASVSPASNDQGADIIAERDGAKIAIQCKKYSSPVGNKAVQEVSASKLHYGTHHAAVVTNNTFTNSAKQLANSTNVLLLHHSDLAKLDSFLPNRLANA